MIDRYRACVPVYTQCHAQSSNDGLRAFLEMRLEACELLQASLRLSHFTILNQRDNESQRRSREPYIASISTRQAKHHSLIPFRSIKAIAISHHPHTLAIYMALSSTDLSHNLSLRHSYDELLVCRLLTSSFALSAPEATASATWSLVS